MRKQWTLWTCLFVGAFLFASIWTLVSAKPAHAASPSITCTAGTATTTYDPGITNTPRSISFTADETLGPCVDPNDPTLTGGEGSAEGTLVTSCTSVSSIGYQETVDWNNSSHQHTTATYTTAKVIKLANGSTAVTSTGTVTDGLGLGDSATRTIVIANADLTACSTPEGITSNSGPDTVQFT